VGEPELLQRAKPIGIAVEHVEVHQGHSMTKSRAAASGTPP
jgi:hypothetical protein